MSTHQNKSTTPAQRRRKLEAEISTAHDWLEGQTYGGSGTQLSSTDTCRICGLVRQYFSDSQNEVEPHNTYSVEGETLTVSQAAKRGCP